MVSWNPQGNPKLLSGSAMVLIAGATLEQALPAQ